MEKIFIDKNGEKLIIKHRKSAVFFEREGDKNNTKMNFRGDATYFAKEELNKNYEFEESVWKELVSYFEKIAVEAWKDFKMKNAESFGEDYFEYYDKDFDGNGYIRIRKKGLQLEGPAAQTPNKENIRLYKFRKNKFQTFLYDLKN